MTEQQDRLAERYSQLQDYQLLALLREGGLTPEAEEVLLLVLKERGLDQRILRKRLQEEAKEDSLDETEVPEDDHYQEIGGWLVLIGIGLFLGILADVIVLAMTIEEAFIDNDWINEVYATRPGLVTNLFIYYTYSIASLVFMLVFQGYAIKLFSEKRKKFPKTFIALVVLNVIFIGLDYTAAMVLLNSEPSYPAAPGAMGSIIWVVYILISDRVKRTFVN